MAESVEELRNLLMKVKEESEKVGLKLNIQKTKIMASGPITSWQINGWGLILNANSPLLLSCWGFSFALGHGVSSQLLQRLPSYWGFSDLGRGVSPHSRSSKAQLLLLTLDVGYCSCCWATQLLLPPAWCSRCLLQSRVAAVPSLHGE